MIRFLVSLRLFHILIHSYFLPFIDADHSKSRFGNVTKE